MWKRREIKKRAKANLSGKYWKMFFVVMLSSVIFLPGIFNNMVGVNLNFNNIVSQASNNTKNENSVSKIAQVLENADGNISGDEIMEVFDENLEEGEYIEQDNGIYSYNNDFMSISIITLVAFLITVPMMIGTYRYIMNAKKDENKLEDVFFGFSKYYKNIVVTYFIKSAYILLWSLLFVIPGIIKSYQYYMVEFILADNPEIGIEEAHRLSTKMTDGNKWNIFLLDMSFIWWFFFGFVFALVVLAVYKSFIAFLLLVALALGMFFIVPYYEATKVELYLKLKEKISDEIEQKVK